MQDEHLSYHKHPAQALFSPPLSFQLRRLRLHAGDPAAGAAGGRPVAGGHRGRAAVPCAETWAQGRLQHRRH